MRRIVVCADGTWNVPDQSRDDYDVRKPTNVVKLSRAVLPVDSRGTSQLVFYDSGIGSGNVLDRLVGGATGKGISANILESYRFLINNHSAGDQIYLFGYSRGAYTVRSLAGLIDAIGLLPKANDYWLPEGYDLYKETATKKDLQRYKALNKTLDVQISMLGVWDTVGALGIPVGVLSALTRKKHAFHNVSLPNCVLAGYQALAIDEHRENFKPAIWDSQLRVHQSVEQAWFPGVHGNIGGGCHDDGLANCALHWMVDRSASLGLETDSAYLSHFLPYPEDTIYESRKGVYRLAGKFPRTIGSTKHGNEVIHPSAMDRWNSKKLKGDDKYRPKNLGEYLNRAHAKPRKNRKD